MSRLNELNQDSLKEKFDSNYEINSPTNLSGKIINNIENVPIKSKNQVISKGCEENIFCCCINYDLNMTEYTNFINLKKLCLPAFDEKNERHENLLDEILVEIKAKNLQTFEEKSNEEIWRKLGFQTNNPRTDFRAGGFVSVQFIYYFISKHNKDFINIISEDYFTFSLACIRLTYLLKVFLYLTDDNDMNINIKMKKYLICNRRIIKKFCCILSNHTESDFKNAFLEILSQLLIFVNRRFNTKMNINNKEINYLLIEPIINESISVLSTTLNNANISYSANFNIYDNFLDNLKQNFIDNNNSIIINK